jgi:hypothetical protein
MPEETIEKTKSETKELFVGSKKVANFHVSTGTNLVGVLYENGQSEDFTAEQWEGVRSETAYDDGLVAINKYEGLIKRIIREMLESRVDIKSKDWILDRVDQTIVGNYQKAVAKCFGVPKREDITLYQIDATLKAGDNHS